MSKQTSDRDMEKEGGEKSCFQRFKSAFSLMPPGANPPNWRILWLVFIALFSSSFTLTFLFPFLPEMVLHFGYAEEEKGTYVGIIASSVFAGRTVGSFFWGWLSDIKGRRLVLLITILFNGLFAFLFGLVDSLPFALVLRFLSGLFNGTVGVAKTVLYDVSDNTNQAFSMSTISISWGSGLIMGPLVGGYLAVPAKKYPSVFSPDGFFGDFPFVLPSVCCLVVCSIVFIIIFFKFEEPALVLNTQIEVTTDVAKNNEESSPLDKDSPLCHPLINKLRSESTAFIPLRSNKVHMSLETLHCEADLSYYYAHLNSQTRNRFSGDKATSKSLHNLSPTLLHEDEDVLPTSRKRSYSHGHHTEPVNENSQLRTVCAPFKNGNVKHIALEDNGNAAPVSVDIDIIVTDVEKEALMTDTHQVNGGGVAGRNEVAGMKKEEREVEGENKKRSRLGSCWYAVRHSSFIELVSMTGVRQSIALYTVMSFAVIGYEDVFTIFAATITDYDGLGFSTDQIGVALGALSIPLMFIQIKVYPLLVSKVGIKRAFLGCVFFMFIPMQMVPMVHMLVDQKVWLWVCLVVLMLPLRVATNSCFTGSSLLINNSVTTRMAGQVNGLGMTCTAFARTLAPVIGGAMFSWSIKMSQKYGAPLDVNLTFVFFGLVLFISGLQCVFLPDHLDHQKK